jgi:hypothetical protein
MVRSSSKLQFSLEFEPSITEQFRTFEQCLAAVVHGSRIGLTGVAIHCDVAPSALSRMLSGGTDTRVLPADLVPRIIEATQDYRPIHWLVAKFLPDESTRQRVAIQRLEALVPELHDTLAALAVLRKGTK